MIFLFTLLLLAWFCELENLGDLDVGLIWFALFEILGELMILSQWISKLPCAP